MKFTPLFCIALCFFVGVHLPAVAQNTTREPQAASGQLRPHRSPVDSVLGQLRAYYLGSAFDVSINAVAEPMPDLAAALGYRNSMRADGSWADLNYASKARSGWEPMEHLFRIQEMTRCAMRADRPIRPEDKAALLEGIHLAFSFWIQNDFQCTNWWANEIGTPKDLGLSAILLGKELNEAEYQYVTGTLLSRYPVSRTGQNKIWLAVNALYLALLRNDNASIDQLAPILWDELRISTDEGIQPDFSFHQHGAQQQFGNYGSAFALDTSQWGLFLRNTPWAMPDDKLVIFRSYLLNGLAWTCWRGGMDISAFGRQFFPGSAIDKSARIVRAMEQTAFFDPDHAGDYRRFISFNKIPDPANGPSEFSNLHNDLLGNRYFWRSDYLVHRTAQFSATLKMSSTRVIGAELINSENLSGYHTADGALYFYRTGREYDDVFPAWDWRKIPGVTCSQIPPPDYKRSFINSEMVGGVSNGDYGIAMLQYARADDPVTASKAYFFLGDTIVCLGAGISGESPAGIATTINQCLATEAPTTNQTPSGVDFVELDGWRYTILDKGRAALRLDSGPVTGNWHKVFNNPETPKQDVTKNVFCLWLDHGTDAKTDTYAYAVTIAGQTPPIKIHQNSDALQVVELNGSHSTLYGLVFWKAATATLPQGCSIAANHPCLLLFNPTTQTITIAEPTQKLRELSLTINGIVFPVSLPAEGNAGLSVMISVKTNK